MTSPHGQPQAVATRALKLPQVGMIRGKSVRLILKKRPHQTIFAMPTDAGNQHQRNYAAF